MNIVPSRQHILIMMATNATNTTGNKPMYNDIINTDHGCLY